MRLGPQSNEEPLRGRAAYHAAQAHHNDSTIVEVLRTARMIRHLPADADQDVPVPISRDVAISLYFDQTMKTSFNLPEQLKSTSLRLQKNAQQILRSRL
jgi:hypothetical protein